MGKITGWTKKKENHYTQQHPTFKTKVNNILITPNRLNRAQHSVYITKSSGHSIVFTFDNEKQAKAYAIKYMKAHPKG